MFLLNILLLHSLLYFAFGKRSNILSCGLFAYVSQRDNHNFNWDKFNHLGLDNDERGGDSVGRIIGDDVVKFVNNKKAKTTYQDYVINHKNPDPHHIAIGHTRKASVGIANVANAQPIIVDLEDGGKFVMVHNGTLWNWEDLAKEYNIVSAGKTDSMVLAEIISANGFDVLTKYDGAAALIIKDDREPDTIKVFRGASKNFSGKVDEERPLFYYQESENGMYISSKEDGLYFIGGDVDSVFEFEPNILYTIFEGKIINQQKYDRSNSSSVRVWPTKKVETTFYSTRQSRYSEEEDYNEYYEKRPFKSLEESTSKSDMKTDLIPQFINERKIIHGRLRYWFRKNTYSEPYLANGIYRLDEEGYIFSQKESSSPGKDYFFYCGIMIKDAKSYTDVKVRFGKSKDFKDHNTNIRDIAKFSVYPVCTLFEKVTFQNIHYYTLKPDANSGQPFYESTYFTGEISPIFSYKIYRVNHGDLLSTRYRDTFNTPTHKKFEQQTAALFKAIEVDLTEGMCSKVTRSLAEKAVNNIATTTEEVKPKVICSGFLPNKIENKTDSIYEDKKEVDKAEEEALQLSIRDFTNEVEDDDLPDHVFSSSVESDFPTETLTDEINIPGLTEDYEDIDDDDDDNNPESSDYIKKAIRQGLDGILKSIDEFIEELETIGDNSSEGTIALKNLYKLQDAFLDAKDFKEKTLITDYDDKF